MRTTAALASSLGLVGVIVVACAPGGGTVAEEREPASDQTAGLSSGSCSIKSTCGGASADGCWCDSLCAKYGDCCSDIAEVCKLNECTPPKAAKKSNKGNCGPGYVCVAGKPNVCQAEVTLCMNDSTCDEGQICDHSECLSNCKPGMVCPAICYGKCVDEAAAPFCGGIAGVSCPAGMECVDDPNDNCDPKLGGSDCGGVCVPACPTTCAEFCPQAMDCTLPASCANPGCGCPEADCAPPQDCGGLAGTACPDGMICQDDPSDNCSPMNGGSDCKGVCVVEK